MKIHDTFKSVIYEVLVNNILKFWQTASLDPKTRLPFGKVDSNGDPVANEPIGSILVARILWAFSASYRAIGQDLSLDMANVMNQKLVDYFWDESKAGLYYALNSDGTVLNSGKFTDCQAYAIYGLCEYFDASKDPIALEHAMKLFQFVEASGRLSDDKGYVDFLGPLQNGGSLKKSGETAVPRSLNTHLHLLEAYTSLYFFSRDGRVKKCLTDLFHIIVDHFYGDGLFYSNLAYDSASGEHNATMYGMNLETAWLLNRASDILEDDGHSFANQATSVLLRCASKTLAVAVDDDGAVFYSGQGCKPKDYTKQWWVQAEAAVAFLIAYEKSLNMHYFDAFLMSWDFIIRYIVDRNVGEWRTGITKDGSVLKDDHRTGFWKCPYHNSRACLETLKREKLILKGLDLCSDSKALDECYEPLFLSDSF